MWNAQEYAKFYDDKNKTSQKFEMNDQAFSRLNPNIIVWAFGNSLNNYLNFVVHSPFYKGLGQYAINCTFQRLKRFTMSFMLIYHKNTCKTIITIMFELLNALDEGDTMAKPKEI